MGNHTANAQGDAYIPMSIALWIGVSWKLSAIRMGIPMSYGPGDDCIPMTSALEVGCSSKLFGVPMGIPWASAIEV